MSIVICCVEFFEVNVYFLAVVVEVVCAFSVILMKGKESYHIN